MLINLSVWLKLRFKNNIALQKLIKSNYFSELMVEAALRYKQKQKSILRFINWNGIEFVHIKEFTGISRKLK